MSTHPAVVTVATRAPLALHDVPTISPAVGQVRVRVEWTASTPLDMHQADGGLLVVHPQVLGDGIAGTVVEVGPNVKDLTIGDRVFGFTFHNQQEKAHQVFVTVPVHLLGKIPPSIQPSAAVTLPNNFVTVFHALVNDLGLKLPWPKHVSQPDRISTPILIWGASSSVGQFAIQILKFYGYTNIIATASSKHHAKLARYGAARLFDYRSSTVISELNSLEDIPLFLDCIGSKEGSLTPISKVAKSGAKVAVLLPVIVKPATEEEKPVYSMDIETEATWAAGVTTSGVRTHFYEQNELHREKLQPEIMPMMLGQGIVEANNQRIVDAPTLLERAQKALNLLRSGTVSGERLVWKVWTKEEFSQFA